MAVAANLAGCAAHPPKPPGPPHLESTDFDPNIILVGDDIGESLTITGMANPLLRTMIERSTRVAHHQVYIALWYGGPAWQFFSTATDANRQPLDVLQINRSVESCGANGYCTYDETFAVVVPDEALRAAASTGYRFQIRSHGGDAEIITVTPEQIKAQLAAVDPLVVR